MNPHIRTGNRRKRFVRFPGLLLVFAAGSLLVACGGRSSSRAAAPTEVQGIRLATVSRQTSPLLVDAVGTIQPANTSVLNAQIGGTVRRILVKPGDRVHRGEVLALLDNRAPDAQLGMARAEVSAASEGLAEVGHALESAEANLAFEKTTYSRYKGLLAKNSVSRQEFDGAEARYKAALANVQALQARRKQVQAKEQQARSQQSSAETLLSYTRIVSPVNGVVTAKAVDTGTVVMPGAPIVTVEQSSGYRLAAAVPDRFAGHVRLGQPIAVSLQAGDFEGRIAEIVPAADPSSRTFTVKIALPAGCACRSGEYGKASIPIGASESLVAPQHAIVRHGELEGAWVADGSGTLHFHLVTTGRTVSGGVEILSGLAAGERVAVSGVDRLRDGMRVEGMQVEERQ